MSHRAHTQNSMSISFIVVVLAHVLLPPTAGCMEDYEEMMGAPGDVSSASVICHSAKDPQKCESTVQSISPGLNDTTPAAVVDLHIEAALRNTQAGLQAAAQLLSATKKDDAAMKLALQMCVSKYEAAAHGIKDIPGYDKNEDAYYVVASMMSVPDQCQKCEDGIKAAGGNAPSPMSKYNSENAVIMKNLLKIYRTYWYITNDKAFHNEKEAAVDMGYVGEICGKYAVEKTECANSIKEGAKLAQFKGPTTGMVMVELSGKAMVKTREDAVRMIKEKGADSGSAALATCDKQYSLAGKVIGVAFSGQLSSVKGYEETRDAAEVLKSRLAKVTRRFKKCQAAMDKDKGHVDGALLGIQKRLLSQSLNVEALAQEIWTRSRSGMGM